MAEAITLNAAETALVLIDLQGGVLQRQTSPHSAADVLARSAKLAKRFREVGAPVVLVNVSYSPTGEDRLNQPTDAPMMGTPEPGWDKLSPDLGTSDKDIRITKRQWGAFYGTALDLHLRRRGITTIAIGGIATNFGVESTARDAYERGYALILIEDAMAALSENAHQFALTTIFPRLGRVRSTDEVIAALRSGGKR
ncbi:MAG TPA: hydrolase [Gemmatimonadaceae bacterium]|nr:hydrolase [Gemmatimonadaceae bacterium]